MSSTPKKRPKPKANSRARSSSSSLPPPSSSCTSDYSLKSVLEPPQSLFPSKDDFLRVVAVLAIATIVAVGCNYFATSLMNRQPKPFCDTSVDSSDSLYGGTSSFSDPPFGYPENFPGKKLTFFLSFSF